MSVSKFVPDFNLTNDVAVTLTFYPQSNNKFRRVVHLNLMSIVILPNTVVIQIGDFDETTT